MFKKQKHDVLSYVAKANLRSHKGRSIILIISICLMALLIEGIFLAGISFYQTQQKATDITPGPGSNGSGLILTHEQYKELEKIEDIEWAAYVPACSSQGIVNEQSLGINVQLLAPEQVFYKNNYVEPFVGNYPRHGNEILISDTYAQRLKLENPVGKEIMFQVAITDGDEVTVKEFVFTVCGVYKNYLHLLSSQYEEVYTNYSFVKENNPELVGARNTVYVKFNRPYSTNETIERLNELKSQFDGAGAIYKMPDSVGTITLLGIALVGLIIAFSAFLIIYNVYSISLTNDIRFWGMLKMLGASSKQIRSILKQQIWRIFPIGLVLGVLLGYLCGSILTPIVLNLFIDVGVFYEKAPVLVPIIITTFYVWITVEISCRKSFRKVSQLTPIETRCYSAPKHRVKGFTVVSFMLSCVLLLCVVTLCLGIDVERAAKVQCNTDFILQRDDNLDGSKNIYHPLPDQLVQEIVQIPGVANAEIAYSHYGEPFGRHTPIKIVPAMAADIQQRWIESQLYINEDREINLDDCPYVDEENLYIPLLGSSAEMYKREIEEYNILDGKIDWELFQNGGYLIYNQQSNNTDCAVEAGHKLQISFWDCNSEEYVSKELTVMAVVKHITETSGGVASDTAIWLNTDDYKQIYTSYKMDVVALSVSLKESANNDDVKQQINGLMQKYFYNWLSLKSLDETAASMTTIRNFMILVGSFFAVFLAVIGIANVTNSFVNSVLSRKLEYARLQAIGMTKKQMLIRFVKDNITTFTTGGTMSMPVSLLIIFYLRSLNLFKATGTQVDFRLYFGTLVGILVFVVTFSTFIAKILVEFLNKKPLVERLREAE